MTGIAHPFHLTGIVMVNTERIYCLVLRWQAAMRRRSDATPWELPKAQQSIIHLIEHFPELPALEIMDWMAGVLEDGGGPLTFGNVSDVSSPMELIRNDYRGFRMISALCPIRY